MRIDDDIRTIPGIGDVKAKAFAKIGVFTVRDLLYHFPRAYQNRGKTVLLAEYADGAEAPYLLTVATTPTNTIVKRNMVLTKFRAVDESSSADITFFNQPYLKNVFRLGETYRFWGKAEKKGRKFSMSSPEYEVWQEDKPLRDYHAVYPLTSSLGEKAVISALEYAVPRVITEIKDPIPVSVREKYRLQSLQYALFNIHFPKDGEALTHALRRLAFDEFYYCALGISFLRKKESKETAPSVTGKDITKMLANLPYSLTPSQEKVCAEILSDLHGNGGELCKPMRRMLTGDVGSGKTVCAALAIYATVTGGYQAAVMVPTEILAKQHYEELTKIFNGLGIRTELLTGSAPAKEKRRIYAALASDGKDRTDVLIGTHAVISEKVIFSKLGLTVTDEQHRFGVMQRSSLSDKNSNAHMLVMTATPIPRTLALSLYGDLDVSKIEGMPPGRQKVDTFTVGESYRERIYAFIKKQVNEGGQVYIVCPAIDESDDDTKSPFTENLDRIDFTQKNSGTDTAVRSPQMKHAVTYAKELAEKVFPDLRIGLLHGKMSAEEKNKQMSDFYRGDTDILVSTTVIEVGVNVPNANLMIVENAERFGLSQLHQLRGRVGRGNRKSYCILVSDAKGETAKSRLGVMCRTYDGYKIAEEDLLMRGPGDFFGSAFSDKFRQSGGLNIRLAELCSDTQIMDSAFSAAKDTIDSPDNTDAVAEAMRIFNINAGTVS